MIEATISSTDLKRIYSKLDRINPRNRINVLIDAFRKASLFVENKLKENISGKILKVRTGRLRASIGSRINISREGISGVIGSGVRQGNRVVYANIHEIGGIITPKKVQWLTIPLAGALTPAGDLRGGATSARDFANTFIARNIIFQRQGKNIIPLFVLKKQVKIPARKYLSRTLEQTQRRIMQIMLDNISRALK